MYDARVFEIVDGLEPSARGELEITDVNNDYVARGEMAFDVLPGWWTDAGTHASKLKASILVPHQGRHVPRLASSREEFRDCPRRAP